MSQAVATQTVEEVVIKFAGDSGDGMQLTGSRFTSEAALSGNDLRTFPDFPAEIRAPAGTLAGVSAFQLRFADASIYTPGDQLDVLVAMNPAALTTNLRNLKAGGVVIVNSSQFGKRNLDKARLSSNPLEDGTLDAFQVFQVDITKMTTDALDDLGMNSRAVDRCKNFFALGLVFWLYNRSLDNTLQWIQQKFGKKPELVEANTRALKAGYNFGETAELFSARYEVKPASIAPGTYRNISGNTALALGFIAAAERSGRELFLGTYPITPASDILHELARHKTFGVRTFQAEDEIAAVAATVGAAYGGALGLTTTSGPGVALKGEAIGLAVMVELPLVIANIQRGGPSTGLPTKTEQADLNQALFGRNGEAPVPVVAASSPADCFAAAFEASRIALKYMTPVILLSDGALANGTEPWKLPDLDALPRLDTTELTSSQDAGDTFHPYTRDPQTLSRPWPRLGTPGLEHRIGGLEKEHITGGVSYDPDNHEFMIRLRNEKVQRIAHDYPPTEILGDQEGDLLFVGWGSTRGVIRAATERLRKQGKKVSAVHLRNLFPLPLDLGDILKRFKVVACPEMNMGQLARYLRSEYLIDVKRINKIQGIPIFENELVSRANALLEGRDPSPFLLNTLELLTSKPVEGVPSSNQEAFRRFQ